MSWLRVSQIVFAFVQIILLMPDVYAVWVPPEFYEWMKVFNWIDFLDVFVLGMMPSAATKM